MDAFTTYEIGLWIIIALGTIVILRRPKKKPQKMPPHEAHEDATG